MMIRLYGLNFLNLTDFLEKDLQVRHQKMFIQNKLGDSTDLHSASSTGEIK